MAPKLISEIMEISVELLIDKENGIVLYSMEIRQDKVNLWASR